MTSDNSNRSGSNPPGPNPPGRKPAQSLAGGAPLALAMIVGTILGGILGQPSLGLLVGTVTGIAIALIIWRAGTRK